MAHSSHPIPPAGGEGGDEGRALFSVLNVQVCTGTVHVRKRGERGGKNQHEQRREGGRRSVFELYVHSLWRVNTLIHS